MVKIIPAKDQYCCCRGHVSMLILAFRSKRYCVTVHLTVTPTWMYPLLNLVICRN